MKYQEIEINEIEGFRIGNAQDLDALTGTTVIICENGGICGVDVRGGGPASRETNLLEPTKSNNGVHAVMLSGGSAYGLDAAGGIMQYLEEHGIGLPVGDQIVPIVVGSCIFDLGIGNGKVRPDKKMGYDACVNSELNKIEQGNVGAGTGATVGKLRGPNYMMKSGLGAYAIQVGDLKVGAIVAVNAIGDVYKLDSNERIAGVLDDSKSIILDSEELLIDFVQNQMNQRANTTIACIVTNANLNKSQMNKVAAMASNGIARTIRPVNTSMDGDSVYAITTGTVATNEDVVGTLAAYALGKAINNSIYNTNSIEEYKSYNSLNK